ncbi:hypothetical protein J2768_002473 [Agrobacterium tumefaciens]|uniref:hypothetical protein n=1 Tax=Agrobacterium tumefaciens TaxID=358 RepID=UPI001AE4EC6D|nr:hypothetical protein [Agrobacterium tumefaciens]MBP2540036.1 hypothetical protein [Agrobacterium tumefaciens]
MKTDGGANDSVIDAAHRWASMQVDENTQPPLKSGGGGGTFDGMEARVKRLEDDMKEIKGDLKSLLKDSAEIKGKISNMPSTWQIVGIVGVMLGLVIASGGGILGLIRYLQP